MDSLKSFFGVMAIAAALLALITYLRHGGFTDYIIIAVSCVVVTLFRFISELRESRWIKKTSRLAEEIGSKEQREKARNYALTHGFSKLHGKTMKADLIYRVQKTCIVPLLAGALFMTAGLEPIEEELFIRTVTVIMGIVLFACGIYCLTGQSVRSFLKKAGKRERILKR